MQSIIFCNSTQRVELLAKKITELGRKLLGNYLIFETLFFQATHVTTSTPRWHRLTGIGSSTISGKPGLDPDLDVESLS